MNKLIIIGNLTRNPEMREVDGRTCCNFTVAVNRRTRPGTHPQADYIRVTAWDQMGDNCYKFLSKGKKVCVEGPVRAHSYIDNQGDARASLEMTARDVEFLTPKSQAPDAQGEAPADDMGDGFTEVDEDELPFN